MCPMDVQGLADIISNKEFCHENFKDQIKYNVKGFYETGLSCKQNCVPLPDNNDQTRARLNFVTKKLVKIGKL